MAVWVRDAWVRPVGLLLGCWADARFGDPRRFHPVAGFGAVAARVEQRVHADSRARGAAYTALLVGGAVGAGVLVERGHPLWPNRLWPNRLWPNRLWPNRVWPNRVWRCAATAAATWAVLGGSSLAGHGAALADELAAGDLVAARHRIPSLCGRDPASLDIAGTARAGTESMAENTSDAVVAPLLWGAVAGVPGLLGYRAVNTLDAMVGYRSPRYLRFGWASARLDDVANLVPARVAAALFAVLAPAVGGSPRAAVAAWRRDAGGHPSPNAGPVEAAAAGALGVGLGGRTVYAHGIEERPRLGSGPPPSPSDLRRAAHLSRLVGAAAGALAAVIAASATRPWGRVPVEVPGQRSSSPARARRRAVRSGRPRRCSSSRRMK